MTAALQQAMPGCLPDSLLVNKIEHVKRLFKVSGVVGK